MNPRAGTAVSHKSSPSGVPPVADHSPYPPEPTEFNVILEGSNTPGRPLRTGVIRVVPSVPLSPAQLESIRAALTLAAQDNESAEAVNPIIVEGLPESEAHKL